MGLSKGLSGWCTSCLGGGGLGEGKRGQHSLCQMCYCLGHAWQCLIWLYLCLLSSTASTS